MPNTWTTPVEVALDRMLMYLDNDMEIGNKVDRQIETEFKGKGQTVTVPKPPKFEAQDGPEISAAQAVNQGNVPVVVDQWKTVLVDLTGLDIAFNKALFKKWDENYLTPAASVLCNTVDTQLLGLYDQVYNWVGTPGTPPASYDNIAEAAEILTYGATPKKDRNIALSPKAWRKVGGGVSTLFNPGSQIGRTVTTGKPPDLAGLMPFEAPNARSHTVGAHGGTPVTNGAGQVGSSLVTDGWTNDAAILKKGDIFTIADVYRVNPVSKVVYADLQTFRATADVTADGSGNATIPLEPEIIASGAFQTVSVAAGDGKTITVKGTASTVYQQNLAFHKNAFGLVTVPVPALGPGTTSVRRSYKNITLTATTGSDIMNYKQIWRVDMAFGVVVYYPELACRITN